MKEFPIMTVVYFLYDIALFLGSLLYLPIYALRGRAHRQIWTRLGFFPAQKFSSLAGAPVVWLHAVSVGEARAADSLMKLARQRWPHARLVVSTVTATGQAIVRNSLKEGEIAFYAPLDVSWVVKKFLRHIRPSLLMIMETELWPNLIRLAARQGCEVVILNGRISDASLRRYSRIRLLISPMLSQVRLFCMQAPDAAQRIRALGAPADRVKVTGNIKFDLDMDVTVSPAIRKVQEQAGSSVLWIAGSTHEGEEEIILDVYASLRKDFGRLRLLMAPRHLERLFVVSRLVKMKGFQPVVVSRMSSWSSWQIALLDTMGELLSAYRLCDIAFVGGSLVPRGGHNPIEPAVFSKAVIFGSRMDNFREIRDVFIREQAALEVTNGPDLEYQMRQLLGDQTRCRELGERARSLLDRNKGAARRTMDEVCRIVVVAGSAKNPLSTRQA